MPDKKLTDNEIIKALEVCCTERICRKCVYFGKKEFCIADNTTAVLDLINRQKEEIERLRKKCENTQIGYNFAQDDIKTLKKEKYKLQKALNQSEDYRVIAKSEARKEFAERLKMEFYYEFDELIPSIMADKIDNLLKEMEGLNGNN